MATSTLGSGTVVLAGTTSGTTTVTATAVAGTTTLTLPAATDTLVGKATTDTLTNKTINASQLVDASITQAKLGTNVAGTGPTLSYYASTTTTLSQSVFTKIGLQTSVFDTTSGMFASSRFTPTVAGYYQINAAIAFGTSAVAQQDAIAIYKNGSSYQIGNYIPDTGNLGLRAVMSTIVYCNGSTDYIELYGIYNAGPATQAISTGSGNTWFNACLIRGA